MHALNRRKFLKASAATTAAGYLLTASRLQAAQEKRGLNPQPLDLSELLDERARSTRAVYVTGIGVSPATDVPADAEVTVSAGDQLIVTIGPTTLALDVVVHVANPLEHQQWVRETLERKARTEALRHARKARSGLQHVDAATPLLVAAFTLATVPTFEDTPERSVRVSAELEPAVNGARVWQRWTDGDGVVIHEAASVITPEDLLAAVMTQDQFAEVLTVALAFGASAVGAEGSPAHEPGVQQLLGRIAGRPFAARREV